jgi:predicted MPP superfamily phosphohydrolase
MQYPEVSYYRVGHKSLPKEFDGFRIVQLSDLHNKVYNKDNNLLTNMVKGLSPDIVVMTGDMFSHRIGGLSDFIGMVRDLCKHFEVYYVNGNHELSDTDKRTFDMTEAELYRVGANNLDNKSAVITRGGKSVNIYGLCYTAEYYKGVREYFRGYKEVTDSVISGFLGKSDTGFNILIAHNPLDFEAQARWGASLSFGGHVHGGSIRIPVIGGLLSPERRLFPKYQSGLYEFDVSGNEHYLIVSRGLGRFRVNNKPDLVCCTLTAGGKQASVQEKAAFTFDRKADRKWRQENRRIKRRAIRNRRKHDKSSPNGRKYS